MFRCKGATTVLKLGESERRRREPSRAPKARAEVPKAPRGLGRVSKNDEFWCILGGASTLYVI